MNEDDKKPDATAPEGDRFFVRPGPGQDVKDVVDACLSG